MTGGATDPTAALPPLDGEALARAAAYRLEDQIGFALRRAHQRASGQFHDVMAPFDVTPTQFAALAKLADGDGVTQNELGRLTAMDPATIFGVVSRLIRRGYVRTETHPEDGRMVLVSLTEEGARVAAAMRAVAAEVSERTLAPLDAADRATLMTLLGRIA